MAIQVIRQLVTELMQKTRSSLLWHYVLLTLQGKEIKHSFLGYSSAANFWEEIKIRLWPSWGFIALHDYTPASGALLTVGFSHMSTTIIATTLYLQHLPAYQPFSLLLVKYLFSWDCFQAQSTLPEPVLILKQALQKAYREHKGARHVKWKRVPLQH